MKYDNEKMGTDAVPIRGNRGVALSIPFVPSSLFSDSILTQTSFTGPSYILTTQSPIFASVSVFLASKKVTTDAIASFRSHFRESTLPYL